MEKKEIRKPLARAITKGVRVAPSKARSVADLIRGRSVVEAMAQLSYSKRKGGLLLKKTLASALANAENGKEAKREDLYVSNVQVDKGKYLKRSWSRNKGRRAPIFHKMSHFTVMVDFIANKGK